MSLKKVTLETVQELHALFMSLGLDNSAVVPVRLGYPLSKIELDVARLEKLRAKAHAVLLNTYAQRNPDNTFVVVDGHFQMTNMEAFSTEYAALLATEENLDVPTLPALDDIPDLPYGVLRVVSRLQLL